MAGVRVGGGAGWRGCGLAGVRVGGGVVSVWVCGAAPWGCVQMSRRNPVAADAFEFSGEVGGVVERVEVGMFAFDVAEQRLDPGLVSGRGGATEVLGY